MATQKKIDTVSSLADRIKRATAFYLADYRGLKHKQLEELRKVLKSVHADFTIVKNRLMIRALGDKSKAISESLNEPTAVLFTYEDQLAPLGKLISFFTSAGAGKMKAGLMGETMLSEEDVVRLSKLPSRDMLLAQLVGQLKAPISRLHRTLNWNINKFVLSLNALRESKNKS